MKNVKKLFALLLAMAMLFALCACGDDKNDDKKDSKTTAAAGKGNDKDEEADPEDVAKAYAEAFALADYTTLLDLYAYDAEAKMKDDTLYGYDSEEAFFEEMSEDYDEDISSWKKMYKAVLNATKEYLKDEYGDDYKIKTKVTNTEDLDEEEIEKIIDSLLNEYEDYIDEDAVEDIEEAVDVTVKTSISGEDGDDSNTLIVTVVKIDGKWKVANSNYVYSDDYEDEDYEDKDEEADPEDVAADYIKAMIEVDYVAAFDLVPFDGEQWLKDGAAKGYDSEDDFFEDMSDEYGEDISSWKEFFAAVTKKEKEWLEEDFGEYKIKTKVTDTEDMDEDDIEDVIDDLLDRYEGYVNEKKVNKIEEGMFVTIDYTIDGEDDEEAASVIVAVVKYDGKWLVVSQEYVEDYEDEDYDDYEDEDYGDEDYEDLIGYWYLEGSTLVLEDDCFGTLYQGDSEEFEIRWATADGWIYLAVDGEEYYAEYSISGDTLTLLYEDGTVETWTAG